jgi:hypothetical protein
MTVLGHHLASTISQIENDIQAASHERPFWLRRLSLLGGGFLATNQTTPYHLPR